MEAEPATGNNRNQGKRLGTKLGALHLATAFDSIQAGMSVEGSRLEAMGF